VTRSCASCAPNTCADGPSISRFVGGEARARQRGGLYHEEQREGFGLKLLDAYDAVIERALKFPNSGTRFDLKSGFEVRRFQLQRFRYSVFAALVGDELVVFCVVTSQAQAQLLD
jgi:hypothetical protein